MKISIFLSLILLTACNVDHLPKAQFSDCSVNGEQIDCKTFSKIEAPKQVTQIKSEISVAAEISKTQFEILENAENIVTLGEVDCSLRVFAGEVFSIRKSAGFLFIEQDGTEWVFYPTKNPNKWHRKIINGKLKTITILELDDGKFKSSMFCSIDT